MTKQIRRALVSVSDKTGLEDLARALHGAGVQIVSTGSTAAAIANAGVPVTKVEDVTGFAECLDGRVKTLHPRVHAGLLADTENPDHLRQLSDLDIEPFELVVVNLYPFREVLASGVTDENELIEKIDIGGPSMLRGAAKNFRSVAVVTDPAQYGDVVAALDAGGFTLDQRRELAAKVFEHTATYDDAIANWLAGQVDQAESKFAPRRSAAWQREATLRYGENPHQSAALYRSGTAADGGLAWAEQLHGKEMSYNNYVDADAALRAAWDQDVPAVAIIKHANPCGIAISPPADGAPDPIATAFERAFATDPLSAYGGVVAANRPVTAEMAKAAAPIFFEVIVAPDFEPEALEILGKKKNLRILRAQAASRERELAERPISGGLLVQDADHYQADGDDPANWTLAAGPAADPATLAELAFAWRAVRAAKSNAILLARDNAAVGIGMGQVNRVDACKLAVERANTLADGEERARGSVAASDAFFPFADGLQILLDAGVKAVVQPGGSIRDADAIAAANAAGVPMYFTGARHFFH